MLTLLENLVIDRVDLCDEGANSEAFIELFKRKEHGGMDLQEIISKMKPEHAKVVKDAFDASEASLKEATGNIDALTKERDKALADIEELKKKLDEKHPAGCTCKECSAKKTNDEKSDKPMKPSNPDNPMDEEDEDSEEAIKDKKSSGNASFDQTETFKSLSKEVQDYISTIREQKEAAEAELRKSREEAAEAEAVAKAQSLKAIPFDQDKLVNIIKNATPDLLDLLNVVNSAIEGTVLGEVGKTAASTSDSSSADAWSKIDAKATELAKSSNISKAKAVSEVIRNNPDLYREYLEGGAN